MKRLIDAAFFFSSCLVNSFVVMLCQLGVFQIGTSGNNYKGIDV